MSWTSKGLKAVPLLALLAALCGPRAAADPEPPDLDEQTLREAKVGVDGPALLAFLRARTLGDEDARKMAGFIKQLGLLLEESIPGKPVGGNRLSTEFGLAANAAAEALAVIHESGIQPDDGAIKIEDELGRLDRVTEQFAQVHPRAHFLLNDLIAHMRDHVRTAPQEEWLPTHGDLKYDQFIHHNGKLTLLDFDYFALAETSYDLGKFCAYLIPSAPRDWEDSIAAEEMRIHFLRRYRELRPNATLQRFAIYEALQLALRAMAFMWSQSSGWEKIAETFLVMAFERLKSRLPEVSPYELTG